MGNADYYYLHFSNDLHNNSERQSTGRTGRCVRSDNEFLFEASTYCSFLFRTGLPDELMEVNINRRRNFCFYYCS